MAGQQMAREVTLGEHTYLVLPQKIGYLMNKLGPRLQEVLEAEVAGVDGAGIVGAKAHGVLSVFIPTLMPLHEFLGFATEQAMHAGEYNEDLDRSPDAPQVKEAFNAAKVVNGGEVFDRLKALLGPEMTQRAIAALVSRAATEVSSRSSATSAPSPTSPPTSGGSDQTSSGTAPQTSEPSAA